MPRDKTPAVMKLKKEQAKYKRTSWAANNALSISRKILQKTVLNQDPYVESLRRNNADLARRVSELQKELSEQTEELRESRVEAFKLRRKLVRLQSIENIVSSSGIHEKLLLLADDAYRLHDTLSRVRGGLNSMQSSSDPSDENLANVEPASPAVTTDGESQFPWNNLNNRDYRVSDHSVEMEIENSFLSPRWDSSDRQTTCVPILNVEDAAAPQNSSHAGIAQIRDANVVDPSPEADSVPKPKRKRAVVVEKISNFSRATPTAFASDNQPKLPEFANHCISPSEDMNETDKRLSSFEPTNAVSSASSKVMRKKKNYSESVPVVEENTAKVQEKDKIDATVTPVEFKPPSRRKCRKRLRLIQDDSIFIPISDMTMERVKASETLGTNKEVTTADTAPRNSSDRLSNREERVDNKTEKKAELKSKKFNFRAKGHSTVVGEKKAQSEVKNKKSNTRIKALSTGAENRNLEIETSRSASSMDSRDSILKSPIRPRRNTGAVSYVVKLNTKLRQGDEFWCKD